MSSSMFITKKEKAIFIIKNKEYLIEENTSERLFRHFKFSNEL